MRKLHATLSFILALCFIFAGCSADIVNETITTSTITTSGIAVYGGLEYYATMGEDTLKEKCKGKYVEVTAAVQSVLQNIGTIYLGDYVSDKIRFSCDCSNSDDLANVQKGDLVTIRGKCSSFLGSTIYLLDCKIEKHINTTDASNPSNTKPSATPTTIPTTVPPHIHSFVSATCIAPKTCLCGATEGKPNGHAWIAATCQAPKVCTICGITEGSVANHSWIAATCTAPQKCRTCSAESGSAKGHNYSQGSCTTCGSSDPNYVEITYVLNTHTMKFHRPSCHKLPTDNRKDTTMSRDEVIAAGYVACKLCNP